MYVCTYVLEACYDFLLIHLHAHPLFLKYELNAHTHMHTHHTSIYCTLLQLKAVFFLISGN